MHSKQKTLYTVRYLLSKSLDEQITPEESDMLDELIISDSRARRYYVEFLQTHVILRRLHEEEIARHLEGSCEMQGIELWEELAQYEMMAEPILGDEREQEESPERPVIPLQKKKPSKFSLYTLATSIAAVLVLALYIYIMPAPKKTVAILTDCLNCQWSEKSRGLEKGDYLLNEPQQILGGFISLTFDYGAEVVVEGPAKFTPVSADKMILHWGKAYAHVPNKAIGFTIDTPSSRVVDLGTEFGVQILSDGSSEIQVCEGKVNLLAGMGDQSKTSEIVTQNQARKIKPGSTKIENIGYNEYRFARKISSDENRIVYGRPVSLASLVAGGDGFGPGDQPSGIDPSTGQVHKTLEEDFGRTGSGAYCAVADRGFIDGVFVPNGPCVVSSDGHIFRGFPITAGSFWSDITSSPVFTFAPLNENGEVLYRQQFVAMLDTKSKEDEDTITKKQIISMHANCGITFDLNEVRKRFDDAEIVMFRARCGVSINALVKQRHDFWVLLDGQRAFCYQQPQDDDRVQEICIPIRPDQSFLTLATTDGGDNTSFDWCIFENAVLELTPNRL